MVTKITFQKAQTRKRQRERKKASKKKREEKREAQISLKKNKNLLNYSKRK